MKWEHSIYLYLDRHSLARGLQPKTIVAYREALEQYRHYMETVRHHSCPEEVRTIDVLEYVIYLRDTRRNGASAINRAVTILRTYYRALVCMEYMDPNQNPMRGYPRTKGAKRKFRDVLNKKEIKRLLRAPRKTTVMGIRDRTLLALLLGTGIRASECAGLCERDVRIDERIIRVVGKGGDERTVPLNESTAQALKVYRKVRGASSPNASFFKSRKGGGLSRYGIYQRVTTYARVARIRKKVTPHILRHTFATHLHRDNRVKLVVLKELLGHRQLSSTQIYVHMTVNDLRQAMQNHPLCKLAKDLVKYLPNVKLPFQYPPGTRYAFQTP